MGKLTDDLDEEASRLKAAYDTSFGIAKDMPNMVLAAAIAAKKVNAKRLEAAKEAKEARKTRFLSIWRYRPHTRPSTAPSTFLCA